MDCDIVLVGLNHRTAGVDVRERFALVAVSYTHLTLPTSNHV